MDISDTLAPTSDQLDAIDLIGGPRDFTITDVSKGTPDQPINIALAEFPRVWRPGKSMRRVLAVAWGTDASAWIGRRVRLYRDARVRFGGEEIGGTRISALSHIDKRLSIPLIVSRGKSATVTIDPLPDVAPATKPEPTAEQVAATTSPATLRAMWQVSGPERRAQIEARVAELETSDETLPVAEERA